MKGIILAGGAGTRLHPLTKVTSKQLLPVYDKPMIYYPLQTLLNAGIKDILFIIAPERSGDFLNLLGSGKEFGANFVYEVQEKPEGIAQALMLGKDFVAGEKCALILGDNIYTDDFSDAIKAHTEGALVFVKEVEDPKRFGVVEIDEAGKVVSIEEKPENPKSNWAQTGLYVYDEQACDLATTLEPSARGEYEITDLNRLYLEKDLLKAQGVEGPWFDAGTFESLFEASSFIRSQSQS